MAGSRLRTCRKPFDQREQKQRPRVEAGRRARHVLRTPAGEARCLRVLLVEDETLIRMMVAEMVEELGFEVAAEAGTIETAVPLAREVSFDLTILDVNLGGPNSLPIAEILARRGIPFMFASGYGFGVIPRAFEDRPMLRKPFGVEQLEKAVRSLVALQPIAGGSIEGTHPS